MSQNVFAGALIPGVRISPHFGTQIQTCVNQEFTLTHGCLKVHSDVSIILCIFVYLYSQGSVAWSLKNVQKPYSWILSPDLETMIPHLNVNKLRNSTTLERHIFSEIKAKIHRYAEFSFQETKYLPSYARLLGC